MEKRFFIIIIIISIGLKLFAQTPTTAQTTIKYNCTNSRYGVYVKFNQDGPVSIGASLISIILPSSYPNGALNIFSANGGGWTDASLTYNEGGKDYHGISTTGQSNMAYGTANSELLLFEFILTINCASNVRLWTQGTDVDQTSDGTDYISNIFTPANNNYILTTNYAPFAALNASTTGMFSTCNATTNGTINLSVENGICSQTYLWSNGATSQNLTDLGAGTYNVTVTDAIGCSITRSATITEYTAINTSISSVNVLCRGNANGSANLSVSGGNTPYTYLWSNSATTEDLTNIIAGTYNVTVTDVNGCKKIATTTITEPAILTFTFSLQEITCYGQADGGVALTGIGGITPYQFSLDDGVTFPSTSGNFTGLGAGNYKPAIKDANGCITKCQF
jgi:hypothetical protein